MYFLEAIQRYRLRNLLIVVYHIISVLLTFRGQTFGLFQSWRMNMLMDSSKPITGLHYLVHFFVYTATQNIQLVKAVISTFCCLPWESLHCRPSAFHWKNVQYLQPQELGIESHDDAKGFADPNTIDEKLSQEMFNSIIREVVEEIGVPPESLVC